MADRWVEDSPVALFGKIVSLTNLKTRERFRLRCRLLSLSKGTHLFRLLSTLRPFEGSNPFQGIFLALLGGQVEGGLLLYEAGPPSFLLLNVFVSSPGCPSGRL